MHNFYKYLYNDLKIELEGGMRIKPGPTSYMTPLSPERTSYMIQQQGQLCIRCRTIPKYQGSNYCSIYCRDLCENCGKKQKHPGSNYCSISCRDSTQKSQQSNNICKRCNIKPTFDGNPGYCSRYCRNNPNVSFDCKTNPLLKQVGFFYKPNDKLDKCNQLGFLGNFYEQTFNITIDKKPYTFLCAEGAFQSLKDFTNVTKYQNATGDDAYSLSKPKQLQMPSDYHGFGSNWKAMLYVLIAKFSDKTLQQLLIYTPNFLLEHNEQPGRDTTWSDNKNGTGKNWLGLQLMLIKKQLTDQQPLDKLLDIIGPKFDGTDLNIFANTNLGICKYTSWVKYYADELNNHGL